MYVAFIKNEKKEGGGKCPYLLTSSTMWLVARVAHRWTAEGKVTMKTNEPHYHESIGTAQIRIERSIPSLERISRKRGARPSSIQARLEPACEGALFLSMLTASRNEPVLSGPRRAWIADTERKHLGRMQGGRYACWTPSCRIQVVNKLLRLIGASCYNRRVVPCKPWPMKVPLVQDRAERLGDNQRGHDIPDQAVSPELAAAVLWDTTTDRCSGQRGHRGWEDLPTFMVQTRPRPLLTQNSV